MHCRRVYWAVLRSVSYLYTVNKRYVKTCVLITASSVALLARSDNTNPEEK